MCTWVFICLLSVSWTRAIASSLSESPPRAIRPLSGADLRFVSPQPDTSLHCQTMHTRLVHRKARLFTFQLLLVLITPTHKGMARLS